MAYATLSDVKDRLSEDELVRLTDDEASGTISTSRVDQAIDNAGAMIDSYLEGRYSLPLSPVPAVIKKTALDLCVVYLLERKGIESEQKKQTMASAMEILNALAKGETSLGDAQPRDNGGISASRTIDDRSFTDDTLKGFL